MAKKAVSFRVIEEKKQIVLYSNVEQNKAEEKLVEFYLTHGYTPLIEEKKKGVTVEQMRDDLKKVGEEYLEKFNSMYTNNGNGHIGFHEACKYYNKVMKEQASK